ncbi:MAG: IS3 family transposase [Actinomycetota bacterium]
MARVCRRYTTEERLQALEAFRKSGMTVEEFSKTWGVGYSTFHQWLRKFEAGGEAAVAAPGVKMGRPKGKKPVSSAVASAVAKTKEEHPYFGARRIQAWCARAFGLGVSQRTADRVLVEAGVEPIKRKKKAKRVGKYKAFERAKPMDLWQSDITQFVCPRTEKRIYLCVFLDDRSRYIVGWSVSSRQTTEMVLAAYEMGVKRYGRPTEALTDQGRQYYAWRGKTEFQEKLKQDGVKHIVSRPHHPQTLGKCERLWQTVKEEFWSRVEVTDVEDAEARLTHWFGHYNFFRPHQALEYAVPAERFFGVAPQMRSAIEATVEKNAEQMAIGERPRQPFYMAAKIGEETVAIAAERGGLVISTSEETKRIEYNDLGETAGRIGEALGLVAPPESAPGLAAVVPSEPESGPSGAAEVLHAE